ncbi:thermonuclease family protein [bacterium]|nr:thermonuclease family protein [bacterium]
MKKINILLTILLLQLIPSYIFASGDRIKAKLDTCIDGDTAWLKINGDKTKVRFLGIDAPESTDKYYRESSDYTCSTLSRAGDIEIEYDSKGSTTDMYDRTLAWVWVDGQLLQERLIKNGLAYVAYVYDDYKYIKNLCYTQSFAIKDKTNIWSSPQMTEGYCSTIDYSNSHSVNDNQEDTEMRDDSLSGEIKAFIHQMGEAFSSGIHAIVDTITSIIDTIKEIFSNFVV